MKGEREQQQQRIQAGRLGGWLSIIVNGLLFVVKGWLALWSGSVAIAADAFHTLSDIATSLILLISIRISGKPGDRQHPFGHERAIPVATIIMATLLAVTGIELGREAVKHILQPSPVKVSWLVLGLLLLTIVVKEILAQVTLKLSRKAQLPVLSVDAWHHRTDAISSAVVIFSLIGSQYGIYWLDGWVGILIAVFIIYTAYQLARDSFDEILGTRPDEHLLQQIESITLSVPEVLGVHDIVVHQYGNQQMISLHIEVDETLSLVEAHRISEQVDARLREELGVYSTVHVDPVMQRTELYQEVEREIQKICQSLKHCQGFHDLRMVKENNFTDLYVDFVFNHNPEVLDTSEIQKEIKNKIRSAFPWVHEIFIKFEPAFAVSRRSRHDQQFGE